MQHQITLKGLSQQQVDDLLPEGLISLCWRGSVAHGMYVPKSDADSIDDKDVMGIYIGPIEHYLGFGRRDVFEKWEGEWDCVFYELRKFVGLLLNCNPNVLSLLWLQSNGIIHESEIGARLREHRDLFVTKKAYHSFSGYAHAQFKKMVSFNQEAQALMQRLDTERADAPELLDIKRGAWPLEKVKAEAERLFELAQEAYVRSSLSPEPDHDRAERLCVKMISDYHRLAG